MKAIILAAGKATRTYPLTVNKPKALMKIANTTLIEHTLQQLQGLAEEAVIVLGHQANLIKNYLGNRYGKIKLIYVNQKSQLGTANAIIAAENKVSGKFLVLMGDDLYAKDDIKRCLRHNYCILTKQVEDVSSFGAVLTKNNMLSDIQEKSTTAKTNLANTGLYVLDKKIFSEIKKLKKSSRGEFELTDALKQLAKTEKIVVEKASFWIPITFPWSILEANETLLDNINGDVYATVEKGVTIRGKVIVGKNSLLRAGTYIEGPVVIGENCDIGPNCYVRAGTSIGNDCRIGNAVEVKNSVVMDNTSIGHLSYVGDSVIGENVNLGAGFIVANLRHDNADVKSTVKGKLISSKRRKLGTIIADNVKTGIRTTIYPGRKIWPGKTTLPGEIVKKDIT